MTVSQTAGSKSSGFIFWQKITLIALRPWHFTRHRKSKSSDLLQLIQKACTVKFYFSDTLDINGKKEPI